MKDEDHDFDEPAHKTLDEILAKISEQEIDDWIMQWIGNK